MSHAYSANTQGPGPGMWPSREGTFEVHNVSASSIAAGRVVMLDLRQTDADTVSFTPGHISATTGKPDSVFNCVALPDGVEATERGILLVLRDTIAAGANGKADILGVPLTVFVDGSGTTITKGAALVANTSGALVIAEATTAGTKIVGYLMQAASVTTATTAPVWFNGWGFGQNAT